MAAKTKRARMRELEKELALECAKIDIRGFCNGRMIDGVQWFEIALPKPNPRRSPSIQRYQRRVRRSIRRAVEYLEILGGELVYGYHEGQRYMRLLND